MNFLNSFKQGLKQVASKTKNLRKDPFKLNSRVPLKEPPIDFEINKNLVLLPHAEKGIILNKIRYYINISEIMQIDPKIANACEIVNFF